MGLVDFGGKKSEVRAACMQRSAGSVGEGWREVNGGKRRISGENGGKDGERHRTSFFSSH